LFLFWALRANQRPAPCFIYAALSQKAKPKNTGGA
jgi:hypothetical protein